MAECTRVGCGKVFYARRSDAIWHNSLCRRMYYNKYGKRLYINVTNEVFTKIKSGEQDSVHLPKTDYWKQRLETRVGKHYSFDNDSQTVVWNDNSCDAVLHSSKGNLFIQYHLIETIEYFDLRISSKEVEV